MRAESERRGNVREGCESYDAAFSMHNLKSRVCSKASMRQGAGAGAQAHNDLFCECPLDGSIVPRDSVLPVGSDLKFYTVQGEFSPCNMISPDNYVATHKRPLSTDGPETHRIARSVRIGAVMKNSTPMNYALPDCPCISPTNTS